MKLFFVTTAFLITPSFVLGAPAVSNVSGTIQNGQTVTIGGAGFGTKTTAEPIRWDNFEDGANGALLSSTGFWSVYSDNEEGFKPQFSTLQNRHALSNKTAMFMMSRPNNYQHDYAIRNVSEFVTTRKIYYDYWIYYPQATDVPGTQYQIKTGRIGSGTGDTYVYPTLIDESWVYDHDSSSHYYECRKYPNTNISTEYTSRYNTNAWNHVQWEVDVDTLVGTDGAYKVWLNGNNLIQDANLDMVINENTYQQIWLGVYLGNSQICPLYPVDCESGELVNYPISATAYFDDVYIDSSLQRIEIGNASTYANCTHRETQVPTVWTDDSISFTANQGSFSNSSAYLFVVDENGDPSAGYPITLSSTEDVTAPASPSGLSVM